MHNIQIVWPRVRKCHQKVPHSQEFTTRSGSSSKTTAVTASCSAMTIHSHSNGRFYPCDLITLCRRIVRRRRCRSEQANSADPRSWAGAHRDVIPLGVVVRVLEDVRLLHLARLRVNLPEAMRLVRGLRPRVDHRSRMCFRFGRHGRRARARWQAHR